jgi:hypothetical protein
LLLLTRRLGHTPDLTIFWCCILTRRRPAGRRWLARCITELHHRLPSMAPRELSLCLLALARAGQAAAAAAGDGGAGAAPPWPGRAFMADYFAASAAHLEAGRAAPQGLANTAVALATLDCRPPAAWEAAFFRAAEQLLPSFSPRDVASTLWALAVLDVRPPAGWMQQLLASMPVLEMSAAQLSGVLWALARLEVQPGGAWVRAFVQRTREVSAALEGAGAGANTAPLRQAVANTGDVPVGVNGHHSIGSSSSRSSSITSTHTNGSSSTNTLTPTSSSSGSGNGASNAFSAVILQGLTAWAGASGRLDLGAGLQGAGEPQPTAGASVHAHADPAVAAAMQLTAL